MRKANEEAILESEERMMAAMPEDFLSADEQLERLGMSDADWEAAMAADAAASGAAGGTEADAETGGKPGTEPGMEANMDENVEEGAEDDAAPAEEAGQEGDAGCGPEAGDGRKRGRNPAAFLAAAFLLLAALLVAAQLPSAGGGEAEEAETEQAAEAASGRLAEPSAASLEEAIDEFSAANGALVSWLEDARELADGFGSREESETASGLEAIRLGLEADMETFGEYEAYYELYGAEDAYEIMLERWENAYELASAYEEGMEEEEYVALANAYISIERSLNDDYAEAFVAFLDARGIKYETDGSVIVFED